MAVPHKTAITPIDGTPVKRMFWSIISDYDLHTGLCELIDNALDLWTNAGNGALNIEVELDVDRQLISVIDNAGGVKEEDLRILITPGGSKNDPTAEVIGIFGVGGKRAGVALAERVEIQTRFRREKSCQIDISAEWLSSEGWELAAYEIPDISPGTTRVGMSHLRKSFSQADVDAFFSHVQETYAWFLIAGCTISVNGIPAQPKTFDNWSFPLGFPPNSASLQLDFGPDGSLNVDVTAGLIWDRDPERSNYGVYVYCNHRLIVKELKTRDVGYFVTSEAGVPHPDASLCRAIVSFQGSAKAMPWNSSKSGINYGHLAFQQVRPTLIRLVSHFSSLSRRLKHEWEKKVFPHRSGEVEPITDGELATGKRLNLPALPKVNENQVEKLKGRNRKQLRDQPWTLGLLEGIAAVGVIERQRLETKNRIALILLDSNFEIALKEYLVHRPDLFPPKEFDDAKIKEIFKRRNDVVRVVAAKTSLSKEIIDKAAHYYALRNKLIHERATVDITNSDVANYQATIQEVLRVLFGVRFPG